jgi:hypothetical protein
MTVNDKAFLAKSTQICLGSSGEGQTSKLKLPFIEYSEPLLSVDTVIK